MADEDWLETGRRLLGHRLRDSRIRSGLTLSQAADRAGLSQSYISDVERGRNLPSLQALVGMADAYGMMASQLLADVYPFGSTSAPRQRPGPPDDGRLRRQI